MLLDGFEYLQQAYPIARGAVRCLVPVDQMTDDEMDMKASEYQKMGDGCYTHAQEILSYKESRQDSA
jgi:hypothetical protein